MSVIPVSLLAAMLFGLSAAQGPWIPGIATHTGVPTDIDLTDFDMSSIKTVPNGACGYGTLTASTYPGLLLAGIGATNTLMMGPLSGCGKCLEVQCNDAKVCQSTAPVTVMIYDTCDECDNRQINLYATAFSNFAPLNAGRVAIRYRQVSCPFTGGMTVFVDTFRAEKGGFIKLAFKNVAGFGSVAAVSARTSGTTSNWRPMKNTYGAIWEGSQLPTLPLDLNVTKTNGQSVVLSGVITQNTRPGDIKAATNFRA